MLLTNKNVTLTWDVTLASGLYVKLHIRPEHCLFYKGVVRAFDVRQPDGTFFSYQLMPNNVPDKILKAVASPIINHPDAAYWIATRGFGLIYKIGFRFEGAKHEVKELLDHLDDYFVENSSYYDVITNKLFLEEILYVNNIDKHDIKIIGGDH